MKTGLVLEGGAMRGLFTAGVLDVFMEQGIEFAAACGISAGASFGCNIKSKQIGRTLRYNLKYSKDPRYGSLKNWLKTGDLFDAKFCYDTLPYELDPFDCETFESNPMDFYVGTTDVETGKCVYHKCTDGRREDIRWIQASASMPVVSKPVEIDGHAYLDGGISDSVPFAFMESIGFDRNVIVLTQPKGYRKHPGKHKTAMRVMLRKYPAVARAIEARPVMYNRQMVDIDQREKAGTALVIRPEESLGIGHTENDPAELQRVYDLGREVALKRLDEVKAYLNT